METDQNKQLYHLTSLSLSLHISDSFVLSLTSVFPEHTVLCKRHSLPPHTCFQADREREQVRWCRRGQSKDNDSKNKLCGVWEDRHYPNLCIVLYIVCLMADSNAYFLDRRETDGRYNAIYST